MLPRPRARADHGEPLARPRRVQALHAQPGAPHLARHDTLHLLNWAIGDVEGHFELEQQVAWLAGVLEARDFPLEHLASNLDIAADVTADALTAVAERLRAAAALVRGRETFLG